MENQEKLTLNVGSAAYEGKEYLYIFTVVEVNGELLEIKLKPSSTFEKKLLINSINTERSK